MDTTLQELVTEPAAPAAEAPFPAEEQPEDVSVPVPDETDRLAADFLRLSEEFPQLQSPAQLPDAVLDLAAGEGISLLDAYLRYRWQEEKKVLAATEKQEQAARQSAGSLSAGAPYTPPEQDAFLRAFRRAL